VEAKDILRLPYQRVLIPDDESGTFTAMITEFPGCIAQGDSPSEAYKLLEETAESWLEGAMESGMPIPEPVTEQEYSGRIVLRMPRSTHRRAVNAALQDGVSLNTFLVNALAERLGQQSVRRELIAMREELLQAIQAPLIFGGIAARTAPTPPEPARPQYFRVIDEAETLALSQPQWPRDTLNNWLRRNTTNANVRRRASVDQPALLKGDA
jgi:antitoxin HicB